MPRGQTSTVIKSSIPTISAAEFATALALRPNLVAWFLGAGASAASGIPTGYAMIRDFKAQVFCRANNLSKREIDTGDQVWIDRIDEFFRKTSILPPEGDPTEYAAAFEAVYPQPRHRRQYIDDAIAKGTPCFGHRVLGSLLAARKVDCVFTTNFDPLVEEAARSANSLLPATEQARPTNAAIDSVERAITYLNGLSSTKLRLSGKKKLRELLTRSPGCRKLNALRLARLRAGGLCG